MGKASNLKKLRKLAIGLAPINVKNPSPQQIQKGSICIAKGMKVDLAGTEINPDLYYKFPEQETSRVNHNRKLKEAYKKAGMQGANAYVNAVNNYVNQNK